MPAQLEMTAHRTTEPRASIGISIYRQPTIWIQECIQSAIRQAERNIEILVRIDGSTGANSEQREWLSEQARLDPRIKLIPGKSRLGTFSSYRKIFQAANGTYIGQVDADDYLHPSAISTCADTLDRYPRAPFAFTLNHEINSEGKVTGTGKRQLNSYTLYTDLVQFIPFHFRLIRRDSYLTVGEYNGKFHYAGDYDLSLRLIETGQALLMKKPLYYYRLHSSNTSKQQIAGLTEEAYEAAVAALKRRRMDKHLKLTRTEGGAITLVKR
jgi:glycosyltransferase involved in cell wall biosynthesis